ncbi:MAG: hypothetical protein AB1566_13545 [Chloroflexota bacterium]
MTTLQDHLAECLEIIENGEDVGVALDRFPGWKVELRPLVETAVALRRVTPSTPPESFKASLRYRILNAAQKPKTRWPLRWNWRSMLLRTVTVVVALCILGTGTMVASADSLPDSPLFSFKLAGEQAQVRITLNRAQRQRLRVFLVEKRMNEVAAMLRSQGRLNERAIVLLGRETEAALLDLETNPDKASIASLEKMIVLLQRQEKLLQRAQGFAPPRLQPTVIRAMGLITGFQARAQLALERAKGK